MQIEADEAKSALNVLLDRVQQGEQIEITRRGRIIARLVPPQASIGREQAQAAADRMRARAAKLTSGPINWASLKADRDTRRP